MVQIFLEVDHTIINPRVHVENPIPNCELCLTVGTYYRVANYVHHLPRLAFDYCSEIGINVRNLSKLC